MPSYLRAKQPGGTFFFTVVTHQRVPLLTKANCREMLGKLIRLVRQEYPSTIDGVLLPDHIHCIWTLPKNDTDFSKRWGLIKARFTKNMNREISRDGEIFWQNRFWEHQIRDNLDFQKQVDYIHYNPVKHGLVASVIKGYSIYFRIEM